MYVPPALTGVTYHYYHYQYDSSKDCDMIHVSENPVRLLDAHLITDPQSLKTEIFGTIHIEYVPLSKGDQLSPKPSLKPPCNLSINYSDTRRTESDTKTKG